jgi:hypothetical protein
VVTKQQEVGGSQDRRLHRREREEGKVSTDMCYCCYSLLSMVLVWRCLSWVRSGKGVGLAGLSAFYVDALHCAFLFVMGGDERIYHYAIGAMNDQRGVFLLPVWRNCNQGMHASQW